MGSALDEEVYELVVAAVNVTKKGHLNLGKCWTEILVVVESVNMHCDMECDITLILCLSML